MEIELPKQSHLRSIYEARFLILTIIALGIILWLHYYGESFNITLFVRVFAGIFFGSLIYLLIGIVIGSLVKTYVPLENFMLKLAGHERSGVVIGALMGILVPVCTCGLLPLFATLVEEKMPRKAAFAFLFSSPAANPVVFVVTYAVFGFPIALLRTVCMIVLGVVGGVLLDLIYDGPILSERIFHEEDNCASETHSKAKGEVPRYIQALWDMGEETLEVGKYYVFAVTTLSIFVAVLDQALFYGFFSGLLTSVPIGLFMGVVFCLCPTADPPIGKTFQDLGLSTGGVVSFFLAGPLLGMAYVGMMFGYLNRKLIPIYIFLSVVFILATGYYVNVFWVVLFA
jgi:uncharacterized membrane protein YraQ (UPF0718 family)